MIFKVEVTQEYRVEFYVDAANRDQAGEIASEVAENIDMMDWDQHGFEDVDVRQIEIDPKLGGIGSIWMGRKLSMSPEAIRKGIQEDGIWVGGAQGHFEHTLDYEQPKPPEQPDPNQGNLLIPDWMQGPKTREIEEGPAL